MTKMMVLVSGNCQGGGVASLIKEVYPDWEVHSSQVFDYDLDNGLPEFERLVREADVVIAQPVAKGYRSTDVFSTEWIRAHVKPTAQVITFPVVYFKSYSPQTFATNEISALEYPYHDADAIDAFLKGQEPAEFVASSMAEKYLSARMVRAEADAHLFELMAREANASVDVRASDIIMNEFRQSQVLHSYNHPARSVLVGLVNRILDRIGVPRRVERDGVELLNAYVYPPVPAVVAALGLEPGAMRIGEVKSGGVWYGREDYFAGVFRFYQSLDRQSLIRSLGDGGSDYLARAAV